MTIDDIVGVFAFEIEGGHAFQQVPPGPEPGTSSTNGDKQPLVMSPPKTAHSKIPPVTVHNYPVGNKAETATHVMLEIHFHAKDDLHSQTFVVQVQEQLIEHNKVKLEKYEPTE